MNGSPYLRLAVIRPSLAALQLATAFVMCSALLAPLVRGQSEGERYTKVARSFSDEFSEEAPEIAVRLVDRVVELRDPRGITLLMRQAEEIAERYAATLESTDAHLREIAHLGLNLSSSLRDSGAAEAGVDRRSPVRSQIASAASSASNLRRVLSQVKDLTAQRKSLNRLRNQLSKLEGDARDLAKKSRDRRAGAFLQRVVALAARMSARLSSLDEVLSLRTVRLSLLESLAAGAARLIETLPAAERPSHMRWLIAQAKPVPARHGRDITPDAWTRRAAYLRALGHLGGPPEIEHLTSWLEDVVQRIRDLEHAIEHEEDEAYALARRMRQTKLSSDPGKKEVERQQRLQTIESLKRTILGQWHLREVIKSTLAEVLAGLARAGLEDELRTAITAFFEVANPQVRRHLVDTLGATGSRGAVEMLIERASEEEDPFVLSVVIDSLGRLARPEAIPFIREQGLKHDLWNVRAASIEALSKIPAPASVEALIQVLETGEGRLQDDAELALSALTGRSFHGNAALWRRYWSEKATGFDFVAHARTMEAARREREEDQASRGGTSFYGIRTSSERIVFVLDVSGSMNQKIGTSKTTKLDIARKELESAVTALPDGAKFNIVFYDGNIRRWSKQMAVADGLSGERVGQFLEERIRARGATNLFGGLEEVFAIAGRGSSDRYYEPAVDTIFFLTDRRPSAGEYQEAGDILRFVREWNRLNRIVIHTIGVGKDQYRKLLEGLAEQNGGQYVAR